MAVIEWRETPLGDIVNIHRGITWKREQEAKSKSEDTIPVLRIPNIKQILDTSDLLYIRGVTESNRAKYAATKNWVLMVGSNGNPKRVGNCVFIDEDNEYLFASFLLGIESKDCNQVDPKYLFRLIGGPLIQRSISDAVQGSTGLKNISLKMLRQEFVKIPPLPEQKKIAAILSSVDDAIQATQAVIDQTHRVKQGLMQQLLTRGIGHTRFKQTEIGEIPYGWEICNLAQVANVIDCKHRTPKYTDQGYPVIRPRDVKEGVLEFSGCLRIPQDEYEDLIENHCPLSGDVVYSRNATFGIASIVDTDRPFAIGQDVCIISGIHMCGKILFYLLNSRVVRKQLDSLSAGSTFKRINLKDIRRFKVPLIPKAEQGEIVDIADSLSEYLRVTNLELDQLIQTKHGLMQDLLTGRVRVKFTEEVTT